MEARKWINKFKASLVLKDADKISILITSMPQFKDTKEMEEVYHLMQQAKDLIESLKSGIRNDMNKIKSNMNFIKSGITFHK